MSGLSHLPCLNEYSCPETISLDGFMFDSVFPGRVVVVLRTVLGLVFPLDISYSEQRGACQCLAWGRDEKVRPPCTEDVLCDHEQIGFALERNSWVLR
eukprot:2882914-Amphidinium_carterae.1